MREPPTAEQRVTETVGGMKKLHQFVEDSKYMIALENKGFDNVEAYRNELFDCVQYRFELLEKETNPLSKP